MYARRYESAQEEQKAEEEIRIPENYDGNAFRSSFSASERDRETVSEPPKSMQDTPPKAEKEEHKSARETSLSSIFGTKLLSNDLLLLLLAFLLMGGEEEDDLPGILIFLMLL